jgi:hypothetical protein
MQQKIESETFKRHGPNIRYKGQGVKNFRVDHSAGHTEFHVKHNQIRCVFHVKHHRSSSFPDVEGYAAGFFLFMTSKTRFWRSLGDTPGILPA